MKKQIGLNILGQLLLLGATLAWGTSFFVLKETIKEVPAFYIIGIRFLCASILLGLFFFKKLKSINKTTLNCGIILGIIVAIAYLVQTLGLKYTTPSRNAFLTAMYSVLCPFLIWIIYKRKPESYNVVAAILCIVGVGLVSFAGSKNEHASLGFLGDILTLISAVFYALQIIYIDKCKQEKIDTVQLLIVNLFVVGVVLLVCSAIFELPFCGISAFKLNTNQLLKVVYLTLVCTLFAQSAQIFGQKYASTSQAAIILSLEAVFGTLFSVILGGEKMTPILVIGFIVIFVSMLICELKPNFAKLMPKELKNSSDKNNKYN